MSSGRVYTALGAEFQRIMSDIATNLQVVRERVAAAARAVGRDPAEVEILAVSKTWPASRLREAAAAGQRAFGENYVQEAEEKIAALADLGLEWHFIGPLQANKTRGVAERCAWVHSVIACGLRNASRLSVPQRFRLSRCASRSTSPARRARADAVRQKRRGFALLSPPCRRSICGA